MELHGRLFFVTPDPQGAARVFAALGLNGQTGKDAFCADMPSLETRLEEAPEAAVLVDIDPQPAQILRDLDALSRRFSDARFIVLSDTLDAERVLDAMRAGARQFLLKGQVAAELSGVLQRFAPGSNGRVEAHGAVIAVLSAGGGCGATTLAVNLANELHLASERAALLIDMDYDYGAIGDYLGARGQYGLADVLAHRGQIDPQLVTSTAIACGKGLHVLLSPASINLSHIPPLPEERLAQVLAAGRRAYAYTVIDAPRVPIETAAELAAASLVTLVVFQLGVKDIKVARSLLSILVEHGVPGERLVAVANRYRSKHEMIRLDEAKKAIGGFAPLPVANDFRSTIRCINFGQLLAEAAPRSPARRDISALAQNIVRAQAGEVPAGRAR